MKVEKEFDSKIWACFFEAKNTSDLDSKIEKYHSFSWNEKALMGQKSRKK